MPSDGASQIIRPDSRPPLGADVEKVLCIKIASRGDLILAAPAFGRLRETRPGASIDLLVGASCRDVAEHLPFFDRVCTVDDAKLFAGSLLQKLQASRDIYRILTGRSDASTDRGPYDEVLIFHRDWRYGALAWLSGSRVRRGFDGGRASALLTHPYRASGTEHHAFQYAGMAGVELPPDGRKGGWRFHETEVEAALRVASSHGFRPGQGPWVAFAFGGGNNVKTRTALKSWPMAAYMELSGRLKKTGYRVVWMGDEADAALLPESLEDLSLAGKLTVAETAAVLSQCRLVIANDTLMLHLADSMGVPTVGLFGPTDPAHYRPLGPRASFAWIGEDLPCSPCHDDGRFPPCAFQHRCMTRLSVDLVVEKVGPLLDAAD